MWHLNRLDPDQEKAYQESLGGEKIRLTRTFALLAVGLNAAFMLLDYWAMPSVIHAVWAIRLVLIAIAAVAFAATWHKHYLRFYPVFTSTVLLSMGIGINTMILLADASDSGRDHYYGGLLLVTFGVYTLTYLKLWVSLSMSAAFMAHYLVIATDLTLPILATNLYFFVSATIIGIVALNVRDRFSQESFLLRHALQQDVLRKHEEARRASHLAEHDSLTGLPNRTRFIKDANRLLTQVETTQSLAAVLFIDLNGFKPINDRHGHAIGDRVLRIVAKRLLESLRANDVVARIGGDEFVACVTIEDTKPATAQAIVAHISERIQQVIESREGDLEITAAVGLALYPTDGTDLPTLLQCADDDMYRIKCNPVPSVVSWTGRRPAS